MIRISRSKVDNRGKPIKPDAVWFSDAAAQTSIALREKKKHEADTSIYGDAKVRSALIKLFEAKCAYCESGILQEDWPIEHFRPKGKVKERTDHSGYYWLTYDWNNLYPSCTHCNEHRRGKLFWDDQTADSGGGKACQFPLSNEATRAMKPSDDYNKEDRLLLDPCRDYPEKHLRYDADGQVHAKNRSNKGKKSIEVFNLIRKGLLIDRKPVIAFMVSIVEMRKNALKKGNANAANDLTILINQWTQDIYKHAGAARYIVNNPSDFMNIV